MQTFYFIYISKDYNVHIMYRFFVVQHSTMRRKWSSIIWVHQWCQYQKLWPRRKDDEYLSKEWLFTSV